MSIAKNFIKEQNLNPKMRVSRLPEGIEDARFKSYFRGWYKPLIQDFGEDKSVHDDQDMKKLAQKAEKAKELVLEKVGANPTVSLWLLDDLANPVMLGQGENIQPLLF